LRNIRVENSIFFVLLRLKMWISMGIDTAVSPHSIAGFKKVIGAN
jgi:hypothetical protein